MRKLIRWIKGKFKIKPHYFALKGDEIVCVNGHVICEVAQDIRIGALYNEKHLHRWRQTPPQPYQDAKRIRCGVCGGLYWHGWNGQNFHFKDGWRMHPPVGGTQENETCQP